MKLNTFFSAFFLLLLFIFPSSVFASSTITAIPPKLEIEAKPGDTIRSTLRVRNDSEVSQIYTISLDDFIVTDNLGTPIPISENLSSRWSLRKWLTAPDVLPVDPKTTQTIELLIRVPSSALPGGHYAMVTYMPNGDIKPDQLKKTGAIIGQRVGTLIYVTVKGVITEKANLTTFYTPKFIEKGPVGFTGIVENLSDIHINPKGFITISDFLGKEVAKIPIDLANIFPENSKTFSGIWNQKWGYGRYKADLDLIYGTQNSVLTATIFFWLFPIRLVIYSLIAIVSILTIIILLNKRSQRHQEELEKEVRELQKEISQLEKK